MDNIYLEAIEALHDVDDSASLTEAVSNAKKVSDYKGFGIFSYSEKTDPGYRNEQGIHEPYRTKFYIENKDGIMNTDLSSEKEAKEAVDALLRQNDLEAKIKEAEKMVDTVAETYRGFEIFYKSVVDARSNPPKFNYEVQTTKKSRWLGGEVESKTYKTIEEAKEAIDDCIHEWNSYADDSSVYNESVRGLIKEALERLDLAE